MTSITALPHNRSLMIELLDEYENEASKRSSHYDDDWSWEDMADALRAVVYGSPTKEQETVVEGILAAQDF